MSRFLDNNASPRWSRYGDYHRRTGQGLASRSRGYFARAGDSFYGCSWTDRPRDQVWWGEPGAMGTPVRMLASRPDPQLTSLTAIPLISHRSITTLTTLFGSEIRLNTRYPVLSVFPVAFSGPGIRASPPGERRSYIPARRRSRIPLCQIVLDISIRSSLGLLHLEADDGHDLVGPHFPEHSAHGGQ